MEVTHALHLLYHITVICSIYDSFYFPEIFNAVPTTYTLFYVPINVRRLFLHEATIMITIRVNDGLPIKSDFRFLCSDVNDPFITVIKVGNPIRTIRVLQSDFCYVRFISVMIAVIIVQ